MSKSKIVGTMALIGFAMGILLVGDVVAGEKIKCRTVQHTTKWEQINVGDEKDHVVALWEAKGIVSNKEGKTFCDGWISYSQGIYDVSPKTGPIANGYNTFIDKDGDKIFTKWDQKGLLGTWISIKGTGKFEGIKGKGTWSWVPVADPTLSYPDWEGEVELPR